MKKQYETPMAEKIEFCYRDQVVASGCHPQYGNVDTTGDEICDTGNPEYTGSTN